MKARPLQEFVLSEITKAGGAAHVCTYVEEVKARIQAVWLTKGRGAFVAIELKNGGKYVNESALVRQSISMIKREWPTAWVYKTNDRFTSGIPDLIICLG